jgi:hypothetical protein
MQSGITLGNVVTEACTVALLQSGAADVPARVRVVDLVDRVRAAAVAAGLCSHPTRRSRGGARLFVAAGARRIVTARAGGVYDHANARMPARFSPRRPRSVAVARPHAPRPLAHAVLARRERAGHDAVPARCRSCSRAARPPACRTDRPTDVLFLTRTTRRLESIGAALILLAWVRWAGASRRKPAAIHTAFAATWLR